MEYRCGSTDLACVHLWPGRTMGRMAEVVLYRADIQGLRPGADTGRLLSWWGDGREYTYATTNIDIARAFGVYAFGAPRDHERSVYRVELDPPIVHDPDFKSDEYAGFYMSHWGTVKELVEETITMTAEEARLVFSRYARWVDGSAVYDDDGYATVPPKWRADRFDAEEIRRELRTLGTYPEARAVLSYLTEHFAS
jgi:hypothetical protein